MESDDPGVLLRRAQRAVRLSAGEDGRVVRFRASGGVVARVRALMSAASPQPSARRRPPPLRPPRDAAAAAAAVLQHFVFLMRLHGQQPFPTRPSFRAALAPQPSRR